LSTQQRHTSFALVFICVMLISFGLTMLFMSLLYARDMSVLINAPLAIWYALCGQPSNDPLILPGLITLGAVVLLAGLGLCGLILLRRRKST
jgi:hypothetical protein